MLTRDPNYSDIAERTTVTGRRVWGRPDRAIRLVCERTAGPSQRDMDILVEFDRPIGFRFLELADYLEAALGRKAALLTSAGMQNIRIRKVARSINESMVYV